MPPARKRYEYRESPVQQAIVTYLRAVLPRSFRVYKITNEGQRTPAQLARAIAEGLLPGWPDLGIVSSDWFGFLEVKDDEGRLSPEQQAIFEWMKAHRIPSAVVRSIDDVRAFLAAENIQTREAA